MHRIDNQRSALTQADDLLAKEMQLLSKLRI
jgi:hypothetical protein